MRRVGLSACSNGQSISRKKEIMNLISALEKMGLEAVPAQHLYAQVDAYSGTDAERAEDLMRFYRDDSITAIFDISGGDLANGVLKHLDFHVIGNSKKQFWGYSDLTTVINAIYSQTGKASVLYQVKNILWNPDVQYNRFRDYWDGNATDLFDVHCDFLQGDSMEGIVVGGNIRCFMKLAGTKYWPDLAGKILLLESMGGESGVISAFFNQLEQMGVFQQISGILLGTFTNYEKADLKLSVYDLLKPHIPEELPVAKTAEIGHGTDARAIVIGQYKKFTRE